MSIDRKGRLSWPGPITFKLAVNGEKRLLRQPRSLWPAEDGITLIELLITLAIGAIIFASLNGVIFQGLEFYDEASERNELSRQVHFAMEQMVAALRDTRLLLLPFNDRDSTNWPENIREETVPASPPIGDSTKATAVLAVTLPLTYDLDHDGFPDADDDRDGLIDEDLPADNAKDYAAGIYLIDDNGNGYIDDSLFSDDDEFLWYSDGDPIDGLDNDGDGTIDEDPGDDMNNDGYAGLAGVDDDGNGTIDEAVAADDDEDGSVDEDWYNPLVFYLDNGTLKERIPVPWDETGDGTVSGRDFIISDIAENVTLFRVERLPRAGGRATLVDITLELTGHGGGTVTLHCRTRVGAGQ